MNVKVDNSEKNVTLLEIEVPLEKFEEGMEKSYRKNMKKYSIPGFRKGKAPRKILERHYGESIFYEDAIEIVCAETYDKAIEDNNVEPIDRPEIDIKQIGTGQNFIYTAKVTIKPEVELGEYKGIEVNKVEISVSDEDIQKEIKLVQEKNSREVDVTDRVSENGDSVNINFEGFVDGVAFEGGKAENHELKLGSQQFIPGFEEQLVGKNIDEEIIVNVKFPEEYHSKDLAGKDAMFKVTINSISTKLLPELDDEFAKDISEFDTLEEYKNSIKTNLEKKAQEEQKRATEDRILDKIVENASFEVPEIMVKNRIDSIIYDFDMNLRMQGLDLAKYLEMMGVGIEDFKDKFKERATKEVKNSLVIEKISKVENVKATDEQVEEELKFMAESYKLEIEDLKKDVTDSDMERIRYNAVVKNTMEMLVQNTKLV